jgi:isoleucyl-tRNA synthetase
MKEILITKDKFKPEFAKTEEEILKYWKEQDLLRKSIEQRAKDKPFTFYDGPITANNLPHYGHVLTMIVKDIVPRYKTMKGFRVDRSLGWDCQGIPVEFEVEKELGFEQKEEIEEYGVEKFNNLCRESVKRYQDAIRDLTERMGRWVNSDEEYATMDSSYIESVWWSLKELYTKGLLYEGYKVVPYSTRAGTTLSNSEVALGGYESIKDPAVVVKLKLKDTEANLLIWTTTPWTLPGNLLVAVNKDFEYVEVEYEGEKYIVGKELVENIFEKDYKVEKEIKGSELIGKEYEPLYPYYEDRAKEGAFKVVHGEHVTLDEGTGLVHQAPYGEEDFLLMTDMGITMFDYLDDEGKMKEEIEEFKGMFYKKANRYIMEDLEKRNLLFTHYDYEHQMPMCWRTRTPLIYKPIKSWYVKVTEIREELVEKNRDINWTPAHFKDGRFGNWLEQARDWALSRNRYWGTPLPIWVCDKCEKQEVLGSYAEVKERSGVELKDPHKPYVDDIIYECSECSGSMKRVNDVIDVWYDSGSMPFARFHYPFENKEMFEKKYPAQFIGEGVDQTRGWFYTLHVLGVALFNQEAFQNVVVNGMALAPDGTKMSKSLRNYPEVNEVIDSMGADALRLYLLSSPIVHGEDVIFSEKFLKEVTATVLLPFWNSVKYYLNYKGEYTTSTNDEYEPKDVMDRWIVAKLNETIKEVTGYMDEYNLQSATKKLFELIDVLSRWYIRRSRDRFVQGDMQAVQTLEYVLIEISKLMAPFAPFISESVYLSLTEGKEHSVHLKDFPKYNEKYEDEKLLEDMEVVRGICSLGLNIRDENRLKVRQPLSKVYVPVEDDLLLDIVKGELNVKEVEYSKKPKDGENLVTLEDKGIFVTLDINISEELEQEGILNEISRGLQVARKESGSKVGEYVDVEYFVENQILKKLIEENSSSLKEFLYIDNLKYNEDIAGTRDIKLGDDILKVRVD